MNRSQQDEGNEVVNDDYDVDDFNFDHDQPTDPPTQVHVWACPEVPGPTLDRRDLVNGHHRNMSYGWTWWSATHIVALPAGMTFYDALSSMVPVEVTITHDVDPLSSGLNELRLRVDAEWSTRKPEQRLLNPADLCEPTGKIDGDQFRLMRDIHRREHGVPRAVVRSDNYGRQPVYMVHHDWPDGTFMQGGRTQTTREATTEDIDDPDIHVSGQGRALIEVGYFIEAFPRNPPTFIRGEGPTFTAAEDALWAKWSRITGCPSPDGAHEYERRGYRNGCGFCKHCGLFSSGVFDLTEIGSVCVVCGVGTYWSHLKRRNPDGTWAKGEQDLICEDHALPSYLDVTEQVWAHAEDPAQHPAPDLSWMAHRIPEGTTVEDLGHSVFHDAFDHACRDLLDTLIANNRTPTQGPTP